MNPALDLTALIDRLVAQGKKNKKIEKAQAVERRKLHDSHLWQDEAVVLYQYRTICLSCAEVYCTPSHVPFIKRFHPRRGVHSEAINHRIGAEFLHLPRRIEVIEMHSQMCIKCFDEETMGEYLGQLELDLTGLADKHSLPTFSEQNATFDEQPDETEGDLSWSDLS